MANHISTVEERRSRTEARVAATSKEVALWLLEKLIPKSGINNIGMAFQVDGRLLPEALASSMTTVLERYEVLRTVFFATDTELTKEVIPADRFTVEIEDLPLAGDGVEEDVTAFVGQPFDLDGGPLVRAGVAAHPDGDLFCVAVHHLVFDATSIALFRRAFLSVYDAVAEGRPVPPEERREIPIHREPEPNPADLAYWRESLRGYVPDNLDLWCGAKRARHPLMPGETVLHTLSAEGLDAVRRLQREVRAPLAAVLLAGYYALLAAHGAGPELVIGAPLDVRGTTPSAIGYHVNVAPLRMRVDFSEGFRQLARRTRDMFLAAMAHSNVSVDDLAAELPRVGSSWQTAFYRHMFNYLPGKASSDVSVNGMNVRMVRAENGLSKFDLEFFAMPSKSDIRLRVLYCTEILTRTDVQALLSRYEAMLIAAAEDADRPLGELAGWSEPDRAVIDTANRTDRQTEPATVLAAIQSQVVAAPDATAVIDAERGLTYQELWKSAGAVAESLRSSGVGQADVVAIAAPLSCETVAAVLGVWLCGAAYLPLDPGQDPAWLAQMLTQAKAKAVLAGPGVLPQPDQSVPPVLLLGEATAPLVTPGLPPAVDPMEPACLICSSEGAEEPVATVLSHLGIANMVGHFAAELAAGAGTGMLALAPVSSIASILDLFLPLSSGGRVIIAPDEARVDAQALHRVIRRHDVQIVQVPPGAPARILAETGDKLTGLRVVAVGEETSPAAARRLLAAGCELHVGYGAAETTGWAICGRADGETGRTPGHPIANTRAFVAAPDGRELPTGVRGELCIAGDAVALGYCGAAEPDGRRFPSTTPYGRHYRTGELARWLPDGTIEQLGPIGRQAAMADIPVSLGDIEAVLRDHPRVRAAAALTVETPDESDALVAFAEVRCAAGEAADLADCLREHLLANLPVAAVPQRVFCLDALPRDVAHRADHQALAQLAAQQLSAGPDRQDPGGGDPLVQNLLELWQRLLNQDVTAQTSFFDAGGHSLLAAKLAQDVEELTGIHLDLPDVFNHPTPAALAARLKATGATPDAGHT